MEFFGKAWEWTKLNFKWVLFGIGSLLFIIFFLWLSGKNKKIRSLETELAVTKAKLQLEGLVQKYEVTLAKLKELRKTEQNLHEKLLAVENSLKERLKADMTAEEIVAKFKELGL